MVGIAGNGNTPFEGAAADGEIAQAAAHKRHHLIAPRLWPDELRMLFVEGQQLVSKSRKLEVIVFLADCLSGAPAFRARSAGAHSVNIKFVVDTILPGIGSLIDVAFFLQPAEQLLRPALMAWLSGADKVIV